MHPRSSVLLVLFLLAAGCGGASDPRDAGADPGGGGVSPPLPGIYVSAAQGDDAAGDGTRENPFRTITKALQAATIGDVVRVRPGLYDAALGEVFPLEPGFGVVVQGAQLLTTLGTRSLTRVVGGGTWAGDPEGRLHGTFVPGPASTLIGLSIQNPEPFGPFDGPKPAPIILAQTNVLISTCHLHGSDKGIRMVAGAQDSILRNCDFSGNGIGIFVSGAGARNLVEGCTVLENGTGVMAFSPGVDFGGGATGSAGRNVFADNDASDFVYFTGTTETAFARDCFWDRATPIVATGSPPSIPNADIWQATGFVDTTGAEKYVLPGTVALP